jgi:hypothetical protein
LTFRFGSALCREGRHAVDEGLRGNLTFGADGGGSIPKFLCFGDSDLAFCPALLNGGGALRFGDMAVLSDLRHPASWASLSLVAARFFHHLSIIAIETKRSTTIAAPRACHSTTPPTRAPMKTTGQIASS